MSSNKTDPKECKHENFHNLGHNCAGCGMFTSHEAIYPPHKVIGELMVKIGTTSHELMPSLRNYQIGDIRRIAELLYQMQISVDKIAAIIANIEDR